MTTGFHFTGAELETFAQLLLTCQFGQRPAVDQGSAQTGHFTFVGLRPSLVDQFRNHQVE